MQLNFGQRRINECFHVALPKKQGRSLQCVVLDLSIRDFECVFKINRF